MKSFLFSLAMSVPLALCVHAASADDTALPKFDKAHTAIVITDPQNDFLAEDGMLHGLSSLFWGWVHAARSRDLWGCPAIVAIAAMHKDSSMRLHVVRMRWRRASAAQR